MNSYAAWVAQFVRLADAESAVCPRCGGRSLVAHWIRVTDDGLGWAVVACLQCRTGARISRVRVPSQRDSTPFEKLPEVHTWVHE